MSNSIRFVGRFYVLSLLAAAVTFWVGPASPARAEVVDVTNTSATEADIDLTVGPGNSARLVGPWYESWGPYDIYSDVDLNGNTLTDQQGWNPHRWYGSLSGTGTFAFTGPQLTLQGAVANTFTGTYQITGTLVLSKTAGVDAIAGDLQIDNANAGSLTVVEWANSDQINNNSVVTLNPTDATATVLLRLNSQNDTIAGLVSSGAGPAIVENTSTATGATLSTLTLNPTSPNSYSFSGAIRDSDGSKVSPLAIVKTGTGTQVLAGTNTHTGGTTVDGGILSLDGSLAKANITVTSGTFGGSGTIKFQDGDLITVGSAGTFDASGGMKWDLADVTAASTFNLLDYNSGGGVFTPPSTLNDLLDTESQASWSLTNIGNLVQAVPVITYAWDKDGDGDWNATIPSINWVTGVPNSVGGLANFLDKITADRIITVDSPVTVGKMKFNNAFKYTISSDTNAITLDTVSGNASILLVTGDHEIAAPVVMNKTTDVTVAASDKTLTISKSISSGVSGTGINKRGAGTLLLSADNTFDGAVTVNAGKLVLGGTNSFTTASVSSYGTLQTTVNAALASAAAITVNAVGTLDINGTTQTFDTLLSSGSVILGGGVLNLTGPTKSVTLGGLTGAGQVVLTDKGVYLGNNAGFTGELQLLNSYVQYGDSQGLGSATTVVMGAGTSLNDLQNTSAGTTFHITGDSAVVNWSGGPNFDAAITVDAGATFTVATGGGNTTLLSGKISGEGNLNLENAAHITGSVSNDLSGVVTVLSYSSLSKSGGAIAIAGNVVVNDGATLVLGAGDQIADTSTMTLKGAGQFQLQGWNETIGGLASNPGEGVVENHNVSAPSTLTVNNATASTYAGIVQDGIVILPEPDPPIPCAPLALTKDGAGNLYLSGANTYTGLTTVKAGTLQLNGVDTLTPSAWNPVLNVGGADVQGAVGVSSKMVFDYSAEGGVSPALTIDGLMKASYNGDIYGVGFWDQGQFRSTTAVATGLTLGWADTPTQVTVMATFAGDANLDGEVDGADVDIWKLNVGTTGGNGMWALADFNYDGEVDGADVDIWKLMVGSSMMFPSGGGMSLSASIVPEPGTLALLAAGLLGLLCYAWRRCRA